MTQPAAIEAYHYLVSGRVQQVYFRRSTVEEARRLGITGWVRNLPDGRVEATAYGSATALKIFDTWLQTGPAMARVEKVEVKPVNADQPPGSFAVKPAPPPQAES